MFFQQFYLQSLGHASYLVGDEKTGQALVFDPRRDVDTYLCAAREQGLRIAYAADSHGHNDYLSGLTELRVRTGADLWGSAAGELGYAHRPLKDRELIEIGDLGVEVLHTPGHTPEHLSLLIYDRMASADTPALLVDSHGIATLVARPHEDDGYVPKGAWIVEGGQAQRIRPGLPLLYTVNVTHLLRGMRYHLRAKRAFGESSYRVTVNGAAPPYYSRNPYR
jgi:hypothetical protein